MSTDREQVELQHRTEGRKVLGYIEDDTVRFDDGREANFKYWAINERFATGDLLALIVAGAVFVATVTWGGNG